MGFDSLRSIAGNFQLAKLFMTALELGVFEVLNSGPLDHEELAAKIDADPRATRIAVDALVATSLVGKDGKRYFNTDDCSRYLVKKSPDYCGSLLLHMNATWRDWSELACTWKRGYALCERKDETIPSDPAENENFILAMEVVTRDAAPIIAKRLALADRKTILDVGAGPGNYALCFAGEAPQATVTHFDLRPTSEIAKKFVAGKENSERIRFVSGDFLADPLGEGFDFIWMSQVLHMLDEKGAARLIARAVQALSPGGTLAVHEHFLESSRTAPVPAAIFSVHMLAVTHSGRAYAHGEIGNWMVEAGLNVGELIDYGGAPRILAATK